MNKDRYQIVERIVINLTFIVIFMMFVIMIWAFVEMEFSM